MRSHSVEYSGNLLSIVGTRTLNVDELQRLHDSLARIFHGTAVQVNTAKTSIRLAAAPVFSTVATHSQTDCNNFCNYYLWSHVQHDTRDNS